MTETKRPAAFWFMCTFLSASLLLLILGQSSAVFAYDFAVSLGLQESIEEVSAYGVEVNRSFGLADTTIYVPLVALSLAGLVRRKRWAIPITGAVMGISSYWATTILAMLLFLPGTPGFTMTAGVEYWLVLGAYISIGIWGMTYLALRGSSLVCGNGR